MRIYRDLSQWYPLISDVEEYGEEADHFRRLVAAARDGDASTLLELGAGAGHLASYLKAHFHCTLTDFSPRMLDLSRALNPECEHIESDMRTLDLQRSFDVVLAHDAIGYMTTEDDLRAAIATASAHLRPGGLAVFIPDLVKDGFESATDCGGRDLPDGSGLRYQEWVHDPDPADTTVLVEFALMIREPGKPVRVEHDTHIEGLFDVATWRRSMADAGLESTEVDIPDPYAGQHTVFVGRKVTANP